MIEARTGTEPIETTAAAVTPEVITVSMVIGDLDNGIDRDGIRTKYNLEKWEITEMFKHPSLKGKKARKKRKMSFSFVDDTATSTVNEADSTSTVEIAETVDPAQVDMLDSIAEIEHEALDNTYEDFDTDNEDETNF